MLEDIINKPVLGTIPHIEDIQIDDEDSVSLENVKNPLIADCQSHTRGQTDSASSSGQGLSMAPGNHLDVVVIKHSRISNFTDFDILGREEGVLLRYVNEVDGLGNPDFIIIPGTKGTINDLKQIKRGGVRRRDN